MCDFYLVLPVMDVNSLHVFLETRKGCGLLMVDHIILDPFDKAIISLPEECCFAPIDA